MNEKQLIRVRHRLQQALHPEALNALGLATGFAKRRRTVTPARLALTLIAALATQPVATIADLQRAFHCLTGCSVCYKPFYNQLAKPKFARFMRCLFAQLLTQLTLQVLRPLPESVVAHFTDILIQDGTSATLHPHLRERWPGRFTNRAPAALEVHTTLSLFHDQVVRISLSADACNERRYLPRPGSLKGKLLLGDRGYEDLEYCVGVQAGEGAFVFRFKRTINPQVLGCWVDGQQRENLQGLPFQEVVQQLAGQHADLEVEWPPKRATPKSKARPAAVRLRLVLLWNPEQKSHLVLATNLERARFSLAVVAQLYRLRWQVELLFKEWKSYANFGAVTSQNAALTEGLLWAALSAALIKRFLAHATQAVYPGVAISTRKAAMAGREPLRRLLAAVLKPPGFTAALRELLAYLQREARRDRPKRERETGRLQTGLAPLCGSAHWLWSHA